MNQEKLWQEILQRALEGVSQDDPKSVFLTLVKPFRIFGNQFVLLADNMQVETWVVNNYLSELQSILDNISETKLHINIASKENSNQSSQDNNDAENIQALTPHQKKQDTQIPNQVMPQNINNTKNVSDSFNANTQPNFNSQPYINANQNMQNQVPNQNINVASKQQPAWMNEYINPQDLQDIKNNEEGNYPKAESMVKKGALYNGQSVTQGKEILFEQYTFETFVVGRSNEFAKGVALAVAEQPGMAYNPVFIYGNSGLGKTHLLAAIANYALRNYPKMSVVYASANDFTNDFVQAVQRNNWGYFNKKYHQADILLIDDIQYLQGRTETIDQLFNIFNEMVNQHKQIVLSADRAPKDIDMDDRMRSRFLTGTTPDINPPDYETRLAILRNYLPRATPSSFMGHINDDVLEYIAEISTSNVREIEGAINQIITHMSILGKKNITPAEAEVILQDFFLEKDKKQITITDIQEEVSSYYNISHEDLISSKRSRDIAQARHIAIYLSRWLTEESLESIGKKFGGRDHTTVMHSVNKIDKDQKDNRTLFDQVEQLTTRIKGHG